MPWRAIHFLHESTVAPLCGYAGHSWNWTRERGCVTCARCRVKLGDDDRVGGRHDPAAAARAAGQRVAS